MKLFRHRSALQTSPSQERASFVPQCSQGLVLTTAQGEDVDLSPRNFTPITRALCVGERLKLSDDEAAQFVCPLGRVTIAQAADPSTIEGPSGYRVFGPTCREYILGAASLGVENA